MTAVAPTMSPDAQADAARLLYARYYPNVYRYALSQLHSAEDAEDAAQNTFLRAFASLQKGTVPQNELAWLFKIAHNVCASSKLAWLRRRRVEAPRDLTALHIEPSSPETRRDELAGLEHALAAMPQRPRDAFLLREMQGLSYAEIAERLDTSQSAVETLIFRARKMLAEKLERPLQRVRQALGLGPLLDLARGIFGTAPAAVKAAGAIAVVAGASVAAAPHPTRVVRLPRCRRGSWPRRQRCRGPGRNGPRASGLPRPPHRTRWRCNGRVLRSRPARCSPLPQRPRPPRHRKRLRLSRLRPARHLRPRRSRRCRHLPSVRRPRRSPRRPTGRAVARDPRRRAVTAPSLPPAPPVTVPVPLPVRFHDHLQPRAEVLDDDVALRSQQLAGPAPAVRRGEEPSGAAHPVVLDPRQRDPTGALPQRALAEELRGLLGLEPAQEVLHVLVHLSEQARLPLGHRRLASSLVRVLTEG